MDPFVPNAFSGGEGPTPAVVRVGLGALRVQLAGSPGRTSQAGPGSILKLREVSPSPKLRPFWATSADERVDYG